MDGVDQMDWLPGMHTRIHFQEPPRGQVMIGSSQAPPVLNPAPTHFSPITNHLSLLTSHLALLASHNSPFASLERNVYLQADEPILFPDHLSKRRRGILSVSRVSAGISYSLDIRLGA
jgi:hypothetical protein